MAIRDILDYQGQKIGELSEPDGVTWTEEEWAQKLSKFAKTPPNPMSEALSRAVSESRNIADQIIEDFKKENLQFFLENGISNDLAILMSLHVHHRLRAVEVTVGGVPFVIDVMNLVISGDLETAYVVLSYMAPDDMTMPYHFLNQDKIDSLKSKIASRVSI